MNPTPETILQSAIGHFARHGFDGARMDRLAEEAGVNKATIYYHFGNKEALYEKALLHVLTALAEAVERASAGEESLPGKFSAYVRAMADEASRNPAISAIMMRELAGGGKDMPESAMAMMGRITKTIRTILAQGMATGVFRTVNPMMIHLMVIGTLNIYVTGEPIRERFVSLGLIPAGVVPDLSTSQAGAYVADLLLGSILTQPQSDKGTSHAE